MLLPDEIEALGIAAERLFDPLIRWLLADICKRVSAAGQFTASAQYDIWKLQELGMSQREVKDRVAKMLEKSGKEVEELLTQAAETGYNFDLVNLPTENGIPFAENGTMQQIVAAAVEMAKDGLTNITQTMGFVGPHGVWEPITEAYITACDFAFTQVSTGATSYAQALKEATAGLRKKGITRIDYESGRQYTVESAVRRSVMSAAGIMQEKISQRIHDDYGCDGWEISAHAASAPDHEDIQGRQYSDADYKELNDRLKRRIGMLNCGHAAFPIVMGVSIPQYSEKELERLKKENKAGIEYDGEKMTAYEATQRQRKLERLIRRNRENILIDTGINDTEQLQTDRIREIRLEEEYKKFSEAAGLRQQRDRLEMAGYDRKQAAEAKKAFKAEQKEN